MKNKNVIAECLALKGIGVNEIFKLKGSFICLDNGKAIARDGSYSVTADGDVFFYNNDGANQGLVHPSGLQLILNGEVEVVKMPWKPAEHETFFSVTPSGEVRECYWTKPSYIIDMIFFRTGNCYRTKAEITAEDIAYHTAGLNSTEPMSYGGNDNG